MPIKAREIGTGTTECCCIGCLFLRFAFIASHCRASLHALLPCTSLNPLTRLLPTLPSTPHPVIRSFGRQCQRVRNVNSNVSYLPFDNTSFRVSIFFRFVCASHVGLCIFSRAFLHCFCCAVTQPMAKHGYGLHVVWLRPSLQVRHLAFSFLVLIKWSKNPHGSSKLLGELMQRPLL